MISKREKAIDFLCNSPYIFAHSIGFEKLNEMHNDWIIDMISDVSVDKTLQAHRGSYKTTCVSVALSILMILYPNLHILFMRKTDPDIKEVIKQVSKILKDPHTQVLVNNIYGESLKIVSESVNEITTNLSTDIKGTSQLLGVGMGSSLTGKHFDRIFTDDIINVNDRISKAERERTKIIYQELHNIKNRGGRIYNTGTPWHKDDAFTIMPNPEVYDYKRTKLITEDEIKSIKESMVPSLFAANYELKHIASDDVIFIDPQIDEDPSKAEQGLCHIDAAYGGEDYTAFTICNRKDGEYYVFGKCWRKSIDDVQDKIIEYRKAFNAGKIYCEDNGDKGYLAKELRKQGERVVPYHENMNKQLKIIAFLKPIWKHVHFVAGTDKEYIEQICDFTDNVDHDDCPDSLSSILRVFNKKKESSQQQSVLGLF